MQLFKENWIMKKSEEDLNDSLYFLRAIFFILSLVPLPLIIYILYYAIKLLYTM